MEITIRERLQEVSQRFETLEVALFTSFNFNADFFEQNVLPALLGAGSEDGPAVREQRVHRGLLHTRVGVLCDPSQIKSSRKPFRYTVYPVFVEGALFHPKNIILMGKGYDGRQWMYVAVMSANLSYAGWGRNCEGFADIWVHAKREQPFHAVMHFLQWVIKHTGVRRAQSSALTGALSFLRDMAETGSVPDPEGNNWSSRRGSALYFSPNQVSMWDFIKSRFGAPQSVKAASPYWGEVDAIDRELGAIPLELVAARLPPKLDQLGLGKDSVQALSANGRVPVVKTWSGVTGRFFHLKLYEMAIRGRAVIGIGSCNFTWRGQFWGSAMSDGEGAGKKCPRTGNVESMLFSPASTGFDWPAIEVVRLDVLPPQSNDEDDAPNPWRFYVYVEYDWKCKEFSWRLQGGDSLSVMELRINGGAICVELLPDGASGSTHAELMSRMFVVRVGGEEFEGCVSEVNLDYSTQRYSEPLAAEVILDSWRSGAPVEPSPPSGNPDDGDESCNDPGGTADAVLSSAFDSFRFFQALRVMDQRLESDRNSLQKTIDWLVGRSDCVAALARAILESKASASVRWIVCSHCLTRLSASERLAVSIKIEVQRLRSEIDKLAMEVMKDLSEELRLRGSDAAPEAVFEWYQRQFINVVPR